MRIYFENYDYPNDLIVPYLGGLDPDIINDGDPGKSYTDRIGYIFVIQEKYTGPIFILPKNFLVKDAKKRDIVLGIAGVYPEEVIEPGTDTNPLDNDDDTATLLPELSLWLFRALRKFNELHDSKILEDADLLTEDPQDEGRDRDFLSTALDLIDFLKDNRHMHTQISLINHSGRHRIDWAKTVQGDPFIENDEPWYLDPAIKDKIINIDEELLRIYYSVLNYLKEKYRFPINLGDVPYEKMSEEEVQRYIDYGIGERKLRNIRHKYYRDDLVHLWTLLSSFFANNITADNPKKRHELLLVKDFHIVFEKMIDSLISDPTGVEDLREQDDGLLIDHIYRYPSLLSEDTEIYYIADSKYYKEDNRPKGVALFKQFSYARNVIQYHINNLYLTGKADKDNLRYREDQTWGYNITPNFFIRSRIELSDLDFEKPTLATTFWDKKNKQKYPESSIHYPDRLFDRSTLLLREFSINLLFVIAAYAGDEEDFWRSGLHKTLRDLYIDSVEEVYEFYKITPTNQTVSAFAYLYSDKIAGRSFMIHDSDNFFILAFEKSPESEGPADKAAFFTHKLTNQDTGEVVTYDCEPFYLKPQ